jgi:hypothetical protein
MFSCLMNTVMQRREPLPFLLASFLYIRLILKASLRLTWAVSHWTGRRSSFQTPQILPVSAPPRVWPCSARRSSSPVSISGRLQHVFPRGGALLKPSP